MSDLGWNRERNAALSITHDGMDIPCATDAVGSAECVMSIIGGTDGYYEETGAVRAVCPPPRPQVHDRVK